MPNEIGINGLQTATRAELLAQYTLAFQDIYGADINIESSTPDGQMINIFIQSVLDNLDLLTQIYNQFDPDLAIGKVLDQRVAINGIQRQAGTYTVTEITLVTSQALNLIGLDQTEQIPYTISDNAGNKWFLVNSVSISGAGTNVYQFRAELPGATLTIPNTIIIPVTVVLGVVSVNNPTTYLTLGINEESDAALKIRRQKSVSLASQGYYAGLLADLENISGMSFAFIEENDSGATNGDGVPGHSIWVIVAGTPADADVAQAIYRKRNAGCGMYGSISYDVTQVDGSIFTIYWDVVESENLFIKFTVTSLDGVNAPNIAAIRSGLVTSFIPGVADEVNINALATAVQAIDPNTLVTLSGFSLTHGGAYTNTLTPSLKNKQFAVSSANIIIIPVQLSPSSATVAVTETQQFIGLGGYGAYTYSMNSAPSGGSINASGLYTAGAVPSVTDVVKVVDADGVIALANVSVIS